MLIANVWFAEVSTPPLSVPPLSLRFKLIVAVPVAPIAGVKVSCPKESIAGSTLNKPVLLFPTT